MWKSVSIAAKIWISFSILVLGYCSSIVLGFRLGKETEKRLQTASESLFTAATESQAALTAFNEQIRFYSAAVQSEDESLLENAQEKADRVEIALQTIVLLRGITPQQRQPVIDLQQQFKGFAKSAQSVYGALASTLELDAQEDAAMKENALQLAQQTGVLQDKFGGLTREFSNALKQELFHISVATRWRRYVELIGFTGVLSLALIVTALLIRGSIVKPLQNLTVVASKIADGDLSGEVRITSRDEFGMLGQAFHAMMAYMQDVTKVAQKLAVGDIHVELTPKSDNDVLNLAFAQTIQYIRDVADLAERISHKDLRVQVAPKSEQDVLNRSLQRMVGNLQEMMEEIQTSIQAVQQQHWIRTGQTGLNEQIRGEQELTTLAQHAITYVARYANAQVGTLYLLSGNRETLVLAGTYAYSAPVRYAAEIPVGEGLVGQVALEQKRIIFDNVPRNYLRIASGFTESAPAYIVIQPFFYQNQLEGVIELGAAHRFSTLEIEFLEHTTESLGIAFHSAKARVKMQALLEETQRQAAELRKQQALLEQANAELRETEDELRQANLQLQEASQHKTDFLANMSHELRTPLNAIIGFTSITVSALRNEIAPEHLENLTKAEKAARLLLQLISDILDFSKIEAGRMETVIETVAIADLIEDVVITGEGLIVDKDITIQADVEPDLPEIQSDYLKLKQILHNLISNAIKFTSMGGVIVRAKRVTSEMPPDQSTINKQQATIRIEVEDTGGGIPADKIDRIFESFKQVDGSIRKKFGGTGLGLAISKRLCESLGITIGVSSQVDKGTLFWLHLPLAVQSTVQETTSALASAPSSMIADDAPLFPDLAANAVMLCFAGIETCAVFQEHLQELPIEIRLVQSAAECVEAVQQSLVWGILIEPDRHSPEALTQLRREPRLAHIPFLVCTMDAQGEMNPVGWIEHLPKPFQREHLLDILVRLTRGHHGDILAVDDDANVRYLYNKVLTDAGYTPHLAQNGLEAIEFFRSHPPPQAVLLDLLMPGIDGFQVLEQLQEHDGWRRVPIIVVTGKVLSGEERKLIQASAKLLVEKSVMPIQELPDQIEAIIHDASRTTPYAILAVDDNQMNLDLLAEVLRMAGYQVYTAVSGAEGIAAAQRIIPDVVLMDLGMPDVDGFEATRRLKQHPTTVGIPVIACSAFATKEFQRRAYEAGCAGYIVKPIEPAHLVEQVMKFMITATIRKKLKERESLFAGQ